MSGAESRFELLAELFDRTHGHFGRNGMVVLEWPNVHITIKVREGSPDLVCNAREYILEFRGRSPYWISNADEQYSQADIDDAFAFVFDEFLAKAKLQNYDFRFDDAEAGFLFSGLPPG